MHTPHGEHEACSAQPLHEGYSSRTQQACQQVQRRRQARGYQSEALMQRELQRQTQEIILDIAAHLRDEAQCVAVATEQDMLAVVELRIVVPYAARTAAKLFGAFIDSDRNAACGKGHSCGHARITTAYDGSS